jgi:hypothetical protein
MAFKVRMAARMSRALDFSPLAMVLDADCEGCDVTGCAAGLLSFPGSGSPADG